MLTWRPPGTTTSVSSIHSHLLLQLLHSIYNLDIHSESVLQNLTLSYKDYIISMSRYIVSLNLKEVNEIFRRAIIRAYFEPELVRFKMGKSKRLAESLMFIDKKYKELSKAVHDSPVINQLK